MALVTVDGDVSRLNRSGGGFGLRESRTGTNGQTFTTYWSVFPKDPVNVQVGDRVQVSGFLRTSVTDPKPDTDKRYVDHLVSNARVKHVDATVNPQAGAGRPETTSGYDDTGWGVSDAHTGAQAFETETPF